MDIIFKNKEAIGVGEKSDFLIALAVHPKSDHGPEAYFSFEVDRLKFFFISLKKLELDLNKLNEWSLQELNLIAPVLRSVIEGFFKSAYIYLDLDLAMQNTDGYQSRVIERFQKLERGFQKEFSKYLMGANVLGGNFTIPSLDKEQSVVKMIDLVGYMGKVFGIDGDYSKNTIYIGYRWCCLFSHANVNPGIMDNKSREDLHLYNIVNVLEQISHFYLLMIHQRCDSNEVVRKKIEELLS